MHMIVTRGILPGITLLDAVEAVVSAIDARNCSFGHSIRVASYAVQIAEAAGWQQQMLEQIQLGALLHDIGQIYWPDTIIEKKGFFFMKEERKTMGSHTQKGFELIKGWPSL